MACEGGATLSASPREDLGSSSTIALTCLAEPPPPPDPEQDFFREAFYVTHGYANIGYDASDLRIKQRRDGASGAAISNRRACPIA